MKDMKDKQRIIDNYEEDYITTDNGNYQIELCQDGRFAVTFDIANLRIKILQNTDYRPFIFNKKKNFRNENESRRSAKIDKTIAYFKINDNLSIDKFYDHDHDPPSFDANNFGSDNFRWSFDISNMQKNNGKYFIFVAVSRINIDGDMKGNDKQKKDDNGKSDYERELFSKKISTPSIEHEHKENISPDDLKMCIEHEHKENIPPDDLKISIEHEHKENIPPDDLKISISPTNENITATSNECKKGVAIYRIELNLSQEESDHEENDHEENENYVLSAVTYYYYYNISGICKFIEASNDDDVSSGHYSHNSELRRFIILNFRGIYNIEFDDDFDFLRLNEKFEYPQNIRRELDNWYTDNNCTERLLSCIYNYYFMIAQYKNGVQSLEVYNLAEMESETELRLVENVINQYNNYETFSVSKLQLCFTQINIVNLFYMENGLQIVSKKFDGMIQIYLSEFIDSDKKLFIVGESLVGEIIYIIWDLYNTDKHESIELNNDFPIEGLNTHLAKTSGNILRIKDNGKVSSILKEVEVRLQQQKKRNEKLPNIILKCKIRDGNHKIYYDEELDFEPIVNNKESWVLGDYERKSYCLNYNKNGSELETLQLIVGRTTVQIWHQIKDDNKNKDDLPNRGKPFLEYIWVNNISVNQEREETRLRIERFQYGGLLDKINDFYLKVYWYERKDNEESTKEKEDKEIDEIEDKIKKINESKDIDEAEKEKIMQEILNNIAEAKVKRCEKVIKLKDIVEKFYAVRHACKALEHLNKRYKSKYFVDNYSKIHEYEEMVNHIEHIVWRMAKYEPENFRLLDIRHNLMKSLILGDCDRMIKFILFGDKKGASENKIAYDGLRHIPSNKIWPGKRFLRDDDLYFDEKKDNRLIENENHLPENNMELAIYHCKGRELKDTIVVAYLLEYYSRNATDNVGWMCTVSKAIPLLLKYKYDDYVRKLFTRRCFVYQNLFLGQDSDEIIPNEYLKSRNYDTKFRAFRLTVKKLKTDKKRYDFWIWNSFNSLKDHYIFKKLKKFGNYDNVLGKSPLALRVVPLPGFTIYGIKDSKKREHKVLKFISNISSFFFIPRRYKISRYDSNMLSPFSRMILYENNDDIYDNPSIELFYRGLRKYSDIFNFFDILSIVFSVIIMTFMLENFQFSDGFGSIKEVDTGLIVMISFSIFLLWVELIMYLRLFSGIGIYIYYVIFILKTIRPFFWIVLIVILGFAHTMFVLLRNPTNIVTKDSKYSGNATNPLTNETFNITLKSDFDPTSSDNPFTSLSRAIMATYFWTSDNWVQRDEFDFWAVDAYTLIASIFLVIVLQNTLIAFMSGVYEKAEANGRQTLLRNRANHIADYEALHHIHFQNPEPEPNHIYYFGQAKYFEEWYNARKDDDKSAIYEGFEEISIFIKHVYKEMDYDKFSIFKYFNDDDINISIVKFKKMSIDMSDNVDDLFKRFVDEKSIQRIKSSVKNEVKRLQYKLEELENAS
ncbi:hypothetical protein C1646_773379 [Rhizophagus diaphanus]|nr:hypothetical protein C1646_773379 [Rhizophagus diaphanus] [Rhizophagus sp. MUCL 43196]